jgi:hypothetical protein
VTAEPSIGLPAEGRRPQGRKFAGDSPEDCRRLDRICYAEGKNRPANSRGRRPNMDTPRRPEDIAAEDRRREEAERIAAARRARRNAARRVREDTLRSLGLKKVRGALGGVYWE